MIGQLPTELTVNGNRYAINSDYRIALLIFQAYDDPDLTDNEKHMVCLQCLYSDYNRIPKSERIDALQQAIWFLDGGDMPKSKQAAKTIDWEQDEKIIFPEINKAAGFEVRSANYMHWWTFLGYFNVIGDGVLSMVISIRSKRAKGKTLEKYETEFYRNHRELIDIRQKLSDEDQAEIDFINNLV